MADTEIEQQINILRLEIAALKARLAVLEARDVIKPVVIPRHVPAPYEYVPTPAPTWWPFTGPTCIDTTAAHEAPPSDPSPACPSPTSGAGGGA